MLSFETWVYDLLSGQNLLGRGGFLLLTTRFAQRPDYVGKVGYRKVDLHIVGV